MITASFVGAPGATLSVVTVPAGAATMAAGTTGAAGGAGAGSVGVGLGIGGGSGTAFATVTVTVAIVT